MQSFKILKVWYLLFSIPILYACGGQGTDGNLPIMGEKEIVSMEKDGKIVIDTIYYKIPAFRFVDQDSTWISNEDVAHKIYLADFFFTRCPTICPLLAKNMLTAKRFLKIYKKIQQANKDIN